MKTLYYILLLSILNINTSLAQRYQDTPSFGGEHHEQGYCEGQGSFAPPHEVIKTIEEILRKMGIPKRNFGVSECSELEVCKAKLVRGTPVILYSPKYVKRLKGFSFTSQKLPTEKDWEFLTILLHEVGHIQLQHLYQNSDLMQKKSLHEQELEADEFAGYHLYGLGASLEQSQKIMYSDYVSIEGDFTHPPRFERLKAIEKGWSKRKNQGLKTNPVFYLVEGEKYFSQQKYIIAKAYFKQYLDNSGDDKSIEKKIEDCEDLLMYQIALKSAPLCNGSKNFMACRVPDAYDYIEKNGKKERILARKGGMTNWVELCADDCGKGVFGMEKLTNKDIKYLQKKFKQLNYYSGPIDGIMKDNLKILSTYYFKGMCISCKDEYGYTSLQNK